MGETWTPAGLPRLDGRTAVVTGGNSGLGFETVLVLARQGAHVVLAARDPGRGDEALGQIRVRVPGGSVELRRLDLADLSSVHTFAEALLDERPQLDLLVNNAGVMAIPRARTADGFEMQLGTNHLGHFALTGLLLPALLKGGIVDGPARVVTLSSGVHRVGRLRRDDLMGERRYGSWAAYGQAKLANLLFTLELHRRARAAGLPLASLAAHPGYAATNLQVRGPQLSGSRLGERAVELGNRLLAQSAEMGAWPTLRAAADPSARSGEFYGPTGLFGLRGSPGVETPSSSAQDADEARWLWERSLELTGVDYPELQARA